MKNKHESDIVSQLRVLQEEVYERATKVSFVTLPCFSCFAPNDCSAVDLQLKRCLRIVSGRGWTGDGDSFHSQKNQFVYSHFQSHLK